MAQKIANNYIALAKYAQKVAHVPDSAEALVGFYAARGQLDKVRTSLARGVLQRNRPEELTWLFGSNGARTQGFSLTMDVRPCLGITPLTWAIGHRRLGLFERLIELGADPQYQHPEGPNAWRHLVDEAPLHQAPPLALMGRMKALGIPFDPGYHGSALGRVFRRRICHQLNGRPIASSENLSTALAWAEALLALGLPPLAADEQGNVPHHIVLSGSGAFNEQQDPRRPWLDLLGRHGGLAWDQANAHGQTPRQSLLRFPELLALSRAHDLDQRPTPTLAPRRRRM